MAFNLFRMSIISLSVIFCKKENIFLRSLLSGSLGPGSAVGEKGRKKTGSNTEKYGSRLRSGASSLISGFANTCDILTLLLEVRCFRGVVTFRTLR